MELARVAREGDESAFEEIMRRYSPRVFRFASRFFQQRSLVEEAAQVHQILDDARAQLQALRKESEPRVAEIRRQADERLQKVLTPDQWKQFQQEREKMLGRERRGRENSSGTE